MKRLLTIFIICTVILTVCNAKALDSAYIQTDISSGAVGEIMDNIGISGEFLRFYYVMPEDVRAELDEIIGGQML